MSPSGSERSERWAAESCHQTEKATGLLAPACTLMPRSASCIVVSAARNQEGNSRCKSLTFESVHRQLMQEVTRQLGIEPDGRNRCNKVAIGKARSWWFNFLNRASSREAEPACLSSASRRGLNRDRHPPPNSGCGRPRTRSQTVQLPSLAPEMGKN